MKEPPLSSPAGRSAKAIALAVQCMEQKRERAFRKKKKKSEGGKDDEMKTAKKQKNNRRHGE